MSLRKQHEEARNRGRTPNQLKSKRASDSIRRNSLTAKQIKAKQVEEQYLEDERIAIEQEGCGLPIDLVPRVK